MRVFFIVSIVSLMVWPCFADPMSESCIAQSQETREWLEARYFNELETASRTLIAPPPEQVSESIKDSTFRSLQSNCNDLYNTFSRKYNRPPLFTNPDLLIQYGNHFLANNTHVYSQLTQEYQDSTSLRVADNNLVTDFVLKYQNHRASFQTFRDQQQENGIALSFITSSKAVDLAYRKGESDVASHRGHFFGTLAQKPLDLESDQITAPMRMEVKYNVCSDRVDRSINLQIDSRNSIDISFSQLVDYMLPQSCRTTPSAEYLNMTEMGTGGQLSLALDRLLELKRENPLDSPSSPVRAIHTETQQN